MNATGALAQMLRKVIGADGQAKSRLHTRRGEPASARQLLSLPAMAGQRLAGAWRLSSVPWIAPSAVRWLDHELSGIRLLELGSGSSTAWYAARCRTVLSIEPNREWATIVRRRTAHLPNVEIRIGSVRDVLDIVLSAEEFDVVVVDHTDEKGMTRADAVAAVLAAGQACWCIVVDDSDRPEYRSVPKMLDGWNAFQARGFRPNPLRLTETTIWTRRSMRAIANEW